MREHPKHKGYFATPKGEILTPSGNKLIPQFVGSTWKTVVNKKRIGWNKFIMECYTGRELKEDEVVTSIDGNPKNPSPHNLIVRTKSEHQRNVMNTRWAK